MANLEQIRARIREYAQDDGYVSNDEWNKLQVEIPPSDANVEVPLSDRSTGRITWNKLLESLKGAIQPGEPKSPNSLEQFESLLQQLTHSQEALQDTEDALKSLRGDSAEVLNKRAELTAKKEILLARMNSAFAAASPLAQRHDRSEALKQLENAFKAITEGGTEESNHNTQVNISPRAQTSGAEQGQKSNGLAGARANAVQFPALKAQVSGGAQFSTDAYMQSLSLDNAVLNIYDDVQQNSKRGRELVMLFAYYAQRAASGDMGAMYQFQKFLTYIISKDKAKQQIDLGKKLVQLQDDSRRATNKLLNAKFDPNDPNASFEQSKLLTSVKSETDAIATSQKLIAQSMEEFGVVVETLTGLEKSSLETWKRIMQKLSA